MNTPIPPGIEDRFNELVAAFADSQTEPQVATSLLAAGLGDRELVDTMTKERKTLQDVVAAIHALRADLTPDCTPAIERLGAEIVRAHDEHVAILTQIERSQAAIRQDCTVCSRAHAEGLARVEASLKSLLETASNVHGDHQAIVAKPGAHTPKRKGISLVVHALMLAWILVGAGFLIGLSRSPKNLRAAATKSEPQKAE